MQTLEALQAAKCTPCEGLVEAMSRSEAQAQIAQIDGWILADDSQSISKKWKFKNFVQALAAVQAIGNLAEADQHHPDLHITGYRHLEVVLTTHSISGLSSNDFILAAKIDQIRF